MYCRIYQWSHMILTFSLEKNLITNSVSLLVIDFCNCLYLLESISRVYLFWNLSTSSKLFNILVHNYSEYSLVMTFILVSLVALSPLICLVLVTEVSLSLVNLTKSLSVILIFWKIIVGVIYFLYCFLFSITILPTKLLFLSFYLL